MGRYDAQQILGNIDRLLKDGAPADNPAAGEARPAGKPDAAPRRARVPVPPTRQVFEDTVLPELGRNCAVDKAPDGGRFRVFKKIWLRLLRPLAGRQAVFNAETLRALELYAHHMEAMQKRLVALEDEHDAVREEHASRVEDLSAHLKTVDQQLHAWSEQKDKALAELQTEISRNATEAGERITRLFDEAEFVKAELARRVAEAETLARQLREDSLRDIVKTGERYSWTEGAFSNMQTRIGRGEAELRDLRARLLHLTEQAVLLEEKLERAAPAAPAPARTAPSAPAQVPTPADPENQRRLEMAYYRFQRQFRADAADLREDQKRYIDLVKRLLPDVPQPRALDLACGDGIFVGLAKDAGWNAAGVDLNSRMVAQAKDNGLPVREGDALEAIAAAEGGSLDLVTAFQFVEHLEPADAMRLLREARRALRPGGLLIVETINPQTFMALKWFHLDLTHQRLVFPEVMELLMESAGLMPAEWNAIHPVEDGARIGTGSGLSEETAEKLNRLLFGPQDYWMAGRKPKG